MTQKPDRLTSLCGRDVWAVLLVNVPLAPFCIACVERINNGSRELDRGFN